MNAALAIVQFPLSDRGFSFALLKLSSTEADGKKAAIELLEDELLLEELELEELELLELDEDELLDELLLELELELEDFELELELLEEELELEELLELELELRELEDEELRELDELEDEKPGTEYWCAPISHKVYSRAKLPLMSSVNGWKGILEP